jgi:hypothetical protein
MNDKIIKNSQKNRQIIRRKKNNKTITYTDLKIEQKTDRNHNGENINTPLNIYSNNDIHCTENELNVNIIRRKNC